MPFLLTFPVSTGVTVDPGPQGASFSFISAIPSGVSVVRSGAATHINTAGLVVLDGVDTGRIDSDPSDAPPPGSSTREIGSVAASASVTNLLTGLASALGAAVGTGAVGSLSGGALAVSLISVAAAGSPGTLRVSAVALTGTAAVSGLGILIPGGATVTSVTGVASTGTAGTVAASSIRPTGNAAAGLTRTLILSSAKTLTGNAATGRAGTLLGSSGVVPFGVSVPGAVLTFSQEFNVAPVSVAQQGDATHVWTDHLWYVLDYHNDRNHYPSGDLSVDLNTVFPIVGSDVQFTAKILPADGQWVGSTLASVNSSGVGFTQQFGFFEARIKMPKGQGLWPAWWLYTVNRVTNNNAPAAELDIMEFQGSEPNIWYATYHSYATGTHVINGNNTINAGFDLTLDYHVFAMKWDTNNVTWYLDGNQAITAPTFSDQRTQMFMIINLAVGGWKGPPGATTPNPSHMLVDYVRAWSIP